MLNFLLSSCLLIKVHWVQYNVNYLGCQKYSMGPNFIYFGAQKYGYRNKNISYLVLFETFLWIYFRLCKLVYIIKYINLKLLMKIIENIRNILYFKTHSLWNRYSWAGVSQVNSIKWPDSHQTNNMTIVTQ